MAENWPTELRIESGGKFLAVSFENGTRFRLPAELMRVESPSAEVKGHGPGQEQLVFGKSMVTLTGAEPVGTYAVRLSFSDGHSTGIFTWAYLEELGENEARLWQNYLAKLEAAELSRHPQ